LTLVPLMRGKRPFAISIAVGAIDVIRRAADLAWPRGELVAMEGRTAVAVRRPNLLGAILIKARVVAEERKEKFDSDRQDLVLLLSFVDDPRALAAGAGMRKSEKKWLRDIEERVGFSEPPIPDLFLPETLTRARQALRLLIG
jgi:hypothetical protein